MRVLRKEKAKGRDIKSIIKLPAPDSTKVMILKIYISKDGYYEIFFSAAFSRCICSCKTPNFFVII